MMKKIEADDIPSIISGRWGEGVIGWYLTGDIPEIYTLGSIGRRWSFLTTNGRRWATYRSMEEALQDVIKKNGYDVYMFSTVKEFMMWAIEIMCGYELNWEDI